MTLREKRRAVVDFIDGITENMRIKVLVDQKPTEKSKLSKKAQHIQKYIQTDVFGCNSKAVTKLMSIVIEEKIPFEENKDTFDILKYYDNIPMFTCLVDEEGYPYIISDFSDNGYYCLNYEGESDEIDGSSSEVASLNQIKTEVAEFPVVVLDQRFGFLFSD